MTTPSKIIPDDLRNKLLDAITESNAIASGRGSSQYVAQTILSQHDRFGTAPAQINSEMVGMTFFTKPRFNMTTSSLRQDPTLALLDTLDPLSFMFSIRCNLDTVFSRSPLGRPFAAASPFFNDESPFNVPLSNMLVGINGFPDFNMEYETTESGYFSEDMTMVRGNDWGRRTYNLSCTFRDVQGGYLMAYLYYWILAMSLQMEGAIVAYPDDREANRLNYSCSIYRFVLDPSMKTIVKWSKATGCFPVSLPIGDVFNFGPGDSFIHTSQQFTVPFIANHIRYMDPRHLSAFNTLVKRYAGENVAEKGIRNKMDMTAASNFNGVPFIELYNGTNELQFLSKGTTATTTAKTNLDNIVASIKSQMASTTDTTKTGVTGTVAPK